MASIVARVTSLRLTVEDRATTHLRTAAEALTTVVATAATTVGEVADNTDMLDVIIVRDGDSYNALYLNGELAEQGDFDILGALEDYLPDKSVRDFIQVWLSDDGVAWLEDAMQYPERFEEIPDECLA